NSFAEVPPLITVVIVDADYVQVLLFAAQFGLCPAGQHVPCLEHRRTILSGLADILRTVRVADYVYHGLRRHQAYARNFPEQRLRCVDRAPYQLPLQCGALFPSEGVQVRGVPARPSQKRNFIYGSDKRHVRTLSTQYPSEGTCEGGEGVRPARCKNV